MSTKIAVGQIREVIREVGMAHLYFPGIVLLRPGDRIIINECLKYITIISFWGDLLTGSPFVIQDSTKLVSEN